MTKFCITAKVVFYKEYEIEAETIEEAIDSVCDNLPTEVYHFCDNDGFRLYDETGEEL